MVPYSYDANSISRAGAGICNAGYTGGMDDENSPRGAPREPEPHLRIDDDGELWFRDEHGQWHKHEWESTGDPELDAIWAMPAGEVERIANDEADPLHEKAQQVQYEAAEPVRKLLETVAHPWSDTIRASSWTLTGLRLDDAWANHGAQPEFFGTEPGSPEAVQEPTMAQLLSIWQATLEEHRRANEYWKQFIAATEASGKRANQNAVEANTLSADANKIARRSLWVAGFAALISVVSAIAAVVSAMP